LIDSSKEA